MYYPINLAEYYLYSGDTAFAESQYQTMKNELAYNAATVDPTTGLSVASGRDWDFYDGSKGGTAAQGGAVSATNMLYYEALVDAGWLAGQLAAQDPGNANAATWSADAATWTSQAATLKNAINSHLFNSSLGVYQLSTSDNGTHPATAVPQDGNARGDRLRGRPVRQGPGHPDVSQEQPVGYVRPAAVQRGRGLLDGHQPVRHWLRAGRTIRER